DNELAVYSAEYERTGFRGAFRVIGAPGPDLPRICKRILGVRSTSLHSSLPARATGAFSRCPVRLSGCRARPVRRCAASIFLTEPDTGLNRSSQRKSAGCSFNFFKVQLKNFLIAATVTPAKAKFTLGTGAKAIAGRLPVRYRAI